MERKKKLNFLVFPTVNGKNLCTPRGRQAKGKKQKKKNIEKKCTFVDFNINYESRVISMKAC